MRHIPVTCEQREAMLRAIGVSSVEDLFDDIPTPARLGRPLELGPGMGEMDLVAHLRGLADANEPAAGLVSFAGAGCYDHYVPSIVDHVIRRPEFFTAYTPYQPEVSQGTLQAIYEFQSMICALTGMDVANASMYDGATAFAEAAFMAARVTRRDLVLVSDRVHPEWLDVLDTYAAAGTVRVRVADLSDGASAAEAVRAAGAGDVAAVMVANPDFFGALSELGPLAEAAHAAGALFVVASNPLLLSVLEPPASAGADIVVGDGQPLGNAMSFGGPAFGFFSCIQKHVRQLPGRLVGRTVDVDGNDAFVLTLSTREQHIRREKATSNICSNQALCALAASVYLAAVGREGLAGTARASIAKAHYLRDRLLATGRFTPASDAPFAHEFALRFQGDVAAFQAAMLERGILAGVRAAAVGSGRHRPAEPALAADDVVVLAVTERRTRAELDLFVAEVASL